MPKYLFKVHIQRIFAAILLTPPRVSGGLTISKLSYLGIPHSLHTLPAHSLPNSLNVRIIPILILIAGEERILEILIQDTVWHDRATLGHELLPLALEDDWKGSVVCTTLRDEEVRNQRPLLRLEGVFDLALSLD